MAYVAINQYPSNASQGLLQGIGEASIYDLDTRPKFAIGTGFKRADGNIYRYASFATEATTVGKLVGMTVANTFSASTNGLLIAPVAAMQRSDEPNGTYPGSIGSRFLWMTLASTVIDQFAGGYITMTKDTGVGYCYRIKGNTESATLNSNANIVVLELYEPLVLATDLTTDCTVIGSLYNDVIAALCSTNHIIVGVTCRTMTGATTAAPKYGWICTHGVCSCLQDGTVTDGDIIQASLVTAGAFQTMGVGTTNSFSTAAGQQILGYCLNKSATTQHATIFLQVE
jgi:hypothetical protein